MGIDYHIKNRDKESHMKKLNNKSSECNTRFDDTYPLYKYNMGIDYYYIKNRDEESHMNKLNNKSSECNIRFDDAYHL